MSTALNSFVNYLADGNSVTSRQARTLFKVENVADLAYRARKTLYRDAISVAMNA